MEKLKINLFKIIVVGLIAILIFNTASPAFADNQNRKEGAFPRVLDNLSKTDKHVIEKHLKTFNVKTAVNYEELSKENEQIAREALGNIEKNLIHAGIKNGEKSIILRSDNKDTFVAITDKIVEVVKQVDEYDFLINGEKHHFEVTISDVPVNSPISPSITFNDRNIQSSEVSLMSWNYHSFKSVNVNAQRNFHTYTASALGGILGTIMALALGWTIVGGIVASLAVGMAYNYAASSQYPTNVGKSNIYIYTKGKQPLWSKKVVSYDYAIYYGSPRYLGTTTRYEYSCVGCGV